MTTKKPSLREVERRSNLDANLDYGYHPFDSDHSHVRHSKYQAREFVASFEAAVAAAGRTRRRWPGPVKHVVFPQAEHCRDVIVGIPAVAWIT
jgi:hypothetical protein